MHLNSSGMYTEPTYDPGGYKQSLRVRGEPWGYGAMTAQPGTYQLDPRGMVPATTAGYGRYGKYGQLGPMGALAAGGGVIYVALGALFLYTNWKLARQGLGGPSAPRWVAATEGVLGLVASGGMVLAGLGLMSGGAVLAATQD